MGWGLGMGQRGQIRIYIRTDGPTDGPSFVMRVTCVRKGKRTGKEEWKGNPLSHALSLCCADFFHVGYMNCYM